MIDPSASATHHNDASAAVGGASGIEVRTDGRVPPNAIWYATHRLERAVERVGAPVRFVSMRLSRAGDPAHPRPATARLDVRLDDCVVHARGEGETFTEAIDLAAHRFGTELWHARSRIRARQRRGATSGPSPWGHEGRAAADGEDETPDGPA